MKDAILISPPFFHYEDHIKFGLESRGYNVFYINHKKNKFLHISIGRRLFVRFSVSLKEF